MGNQVNQFESLENILHDGPSVAASLSPDAEFLPADDVIETYEVKRKAQIGSSVVSLTVEIPATIKDPHPLIICHGYYGREVAYERMRTSIAQSGKVAATFDTPRTQKNFAEFHPKHLMDPARLLCQAAWVTMKQTTLIAEENNIKIDTKFDGAGHSMGGWTLTNLARRHPDRFRTILLNESIGLEDQGVLMMAARLPKFALKELPDAPLRLAASSLGYIARNPIKTAVEGIVLAQSDIREDVRSLKDYDIKTVIMVGLKDHLVNTARVTEKSGSGVADLFVVYSDPEADHLWLQKHPRKAAQAQLEALRMVHEQSSPDIDYPEAA